MRDAFTYVDGFWCDDGFYIGTVHFSRWGGYRPEHLKQFPWVVTPSINSLAEDLGLVKIGRYTSIGMVVDDFGNLRKAGHLGYWQEQWRYPEEWVPEDEEDSDER